jgi:hypothetical protein
MKAYNGDWVPDWTDEDEKKYTIYFVNGTVNAAWDDHYQRFLAFKAKELRDEFLKNFKELIMEAKPLL